jgi:hypothetical protein
MNVTLVFFIIFGILIVILSTFTGLLSPEIEGYVNISEWDVNNMRNQISGMNYVVNDYASHIRMLVNMNAKQEEITIVNRLPDEFDRVENGQCYSDSGQRHLGTHINFGIDPDVK